MPSTKLSKLHTLRDVMYYPDKAAFKKEVTSFVITEFEHQKKYFEEHIIELVEYGNWDETYLKMIGLPSHLQLLHVDIDKFDIDTDSIIDMMLQYAFDEFFSAWIMAIEGLDGQDEKDELVILPDTPDRKSLSILKDLKEDTKLTWKLKKNAKNYFLEWVRLYRQLLTKEKLEELGIPEVKK